MLHKNTVIRNQQKSFSPEFSEFKWVYREAHQNRLRYLKNRVNFKLRKRKFKAKIDRFDQISIFSKGRARPKFFSWIGVGPKESHFFNFRTLSTINNVMTRYKLQKKRVVKLRYSTYPNKFFTKKHLKSRMGKGKGKIFGVRRIGRLTKSQVYFTLKPRDLVFAARFIKKIRKNLPGSPAEVFVRGSRGFGLYQSLMEFRLKSNTCKPWRKFTKKKRKWKYLKWEEMHYGTGGLVHDYDDKGNINIALSFLRETANLKMNWDRIHTTSVPYSVVDNRVYLNRRSKVFKRRRIYKMAVKSAKFIIIRRLFQRKLLSGIMMATSWDLSLLSINSKSCIRARIKKKGLLLKRFRKLTRRYNRGRKWAWRYGAWSMIYSAH